MPTLIHMEDVESSLREILSKFIGGRQVGIETELHHQLGIAGDDAAEFLDDVHKRFGTSFSGFQFDEFFPNETEALGDHVLRFLGVRSRKKPLTLAHLARVVENGRWFEPE